MNKLNGSHRNPPFKIEIAILKLEYFKRIYIKKIYIAEQKNDT